MKKLLFLVYLSITLILSGCFDINAPDDNVIHDLGSTESTDGTGSTEDNFKNRAPLISGEPAEILSVGEYYNFIPSANDPENDTLTFSIENLPPWANFSSSTGKIDGYPTTSGLYENISISVSDGHNVTLLDSFKINVRKQSEGVLIKWQPPSENTEGAPLNNLDGYKIYFGQSQGNYTNSLAVTSPDTVETVMQNIEPGNYYFSMTAITSSGVESDLSNEYYIEVTE